MGKKHAKRTLVSHFKEITGELRFRNFLALILAGTINAFGVTLFLFPVKLYDSGVSGLSMLLDQITPPYFTLSLFLLLINVPIFIFGSKKQGITFTIYSVFTVMVYSVMSFLIMDVLSVIFAKKLGLSLGTFVMIFNTILYIVCGVVTHSWILPLYSIVTYFVGSKTVDFVVEGIDSSKCAMIVTTKAEEISDALTENFQSSGTIVDAVGGYSKEKKEIIYFIINHFQINKLKSIVHEIDSSAFISLQDVSDIIRKAND